MLINNVFIGTGASLNFWAHNCFKVLAKQQIETP